MSSVRIILSHHEIITLKWQSKEEAYKEMLKRWYESTLQQKNSQRTNKIQFVTYFSTTMGVTPILLILSLITQSWGLSCVGCGEYPCEVKTIKLSKISYDTIYKISRPQHVVHPENSLWINVDVVQFVPRLKMRSVEVHGTLKEAAPRT